MKKRIIATLVCLIMIMQTVPVWALGESGQLGKAKIIYSDTNKMTSTNKGEIESKFRAEENPNKYLEEINGQLNERIDLGIFTKDNAPEFIGYNFKASGLFGANNKYTNPATATIQLQYNKVDEIIELKQGQNKPKGYVTVTFKASKNALLNGENKDIIYAVNPKAEVKLTTEGSAYFLKGRSSDSNILKVNIPTVIGNAGYKAVETILDNGQKTNWFYDNFSNEIRTITKDMTFTAKVEPLDFTLFERKLQAKPIKVWKGEEINLKEAVIFKDDVTREERKKLQAKLDEATIKDLGVDGTSTNNKTPRNSQNANLPNGSTGNLKLTFKDGSSLVVTDQIIYVADHKYKVADGSGFDSSIKDKLPEDYGTIEIKLGEGAKVGNIEGTSEGKLYSTFYVKADTGLNESDFPNASAKEGYKNVKWTPADKTKKVQEGETLSYVAKANIKGLGIAKVKYYAGGDLIYPYSDDKLKIDGQNYPEIIKGDSGARIQFGKKDAPEILGYELDGENPVQKDSDLFSDEKETTITIQYKKIDDITLEQKPGYVSVTFEESLNTELGNPSLLWVNPKAGVKILFDGTKYILRGQDKVGAELTKDVPSVSAADGYELVYGDSEKKWPFNNFSEVNKEITSNITFETQVKEVQKPNPPMPPQPQPSPNPQKPEENPKKDKPEQKPEIKPEKRPDYRWDYLLDYEKEEKKTPVVARVPKVEKTEIKKDINKENKINFNSKYISGYEDNTFRPEGKITRKEAASMISIFANLDLSNKSKPGFKDSKDDWANASINTMVIKNLMIADKNGNFNADRQITRAEFAKAISFVTEDAKEVNSKTLADIKGHEFEKEINSAYSKGYIVGYPDGNFRPDAPITRAEAVVILNKIIGSKELSESKENPFKDLKENHWAYKEILKAVK